MSCECKFSCGGLAIGSSIIVGILAAVLSFTGLLTIAPVFYWVTLGVAVVYLGAILIASLTSRYNESSCCVCRSIPLILLGILGTILTSLILLAADFGAAAILGAIIIGAELFFFSLIFTSAACLIRCLFNCD